jgi:predicted Fe-Mo cluster-binding NifX family protein
MTQRIVIPTEDKLGLEAKLAQHFGREPYYTVVDLDGNNQIAGAGVRTEVNKGEHVGGSGHPHEHLLALKPSIFVVQGMGPGCLSSLQDAGVTVLKATGTTVKEITELFKEGKLCALAGGCENPHHHEH